MDPAILATLLRICDVVSATRLLAPFMQIVREGDGETFACEVDRVPCSTCGMIICPKARLACDSGCAS